MPADAGGDDRVRPGMDRDDDGFRPKLLPPIMAAKNGEDAASSRGSVSAVYSALHRSTDVLQALYEEFRASQSQP